jgi:tetratricopeptide (TPR) repeat protein
MSENQSIIEARLEQIASDQAKVLAELGRVQRNRKDFWDRLSALAPIVSGVLIAGMGLYATSSYNAQQLKLQEIQTIEKFIPHLAGGDERRKRAAILALSSIGNTQLAAKMASLFASEGTVSALQSMANSGNKQDQLIATEALGSALDNIADKYRQENKLNEAELAYKQMIDIRKKSYGPNSTETIEGLCKLAELYKIQGDYAKAEGIFKRALDIAQTHHAGETSTIAFIMRSLADTYKSEGKDSLAEPLFKKALELNNTNQGNTQLVDEKSTPTDSIGSQLEDAAKEPAKESAKDLAKKQAETKSVQSTPGERIVDKSERNSEKGDGAQATEERGDKKSPATPESSLHQEPSKSSENDSQTM